ncbi:PadR family transcriptional regulator [Antrihabitans stalactiti]|uniref:PadR family transcriptional regulator n=1 Tax=Antrihabitans stalactiti TaxID=2584121 RepID=A0A848KCY9_9NOCA|nr:PadR family transcriptional regulator [Antrihabitans stalactiti]NMN96753.1 PadR family transcriptional regulator [Antrihabitans stalactiti]
MSAVRLLVLGVIRQHQPVHGYAVHRELASWRIETWTNVKPGSVYHALKQLTKEGRLREAGTEASTTGPGRTLYEVTEAGESEFVELLEAALVSIDMEELGAGIAFMQTLPRQQVITLLQEQRRRSVEARDSLTDMKATYPDAYEAPHSRDLLTLWSGSFSAIAAWTDDLVGRLEAGEYRMAGEG